MPARVLLQDFTGVPCVVDLAAMRDALADMGADPKRANPLIPADLVIDHSVQVDQFGTSDAFGVNALLEFQRNRERYAFLRWGQSAFQNFRVVPPDTGIVHQVNLEYLAPVVFRHQNGAGLSRYRGRHRFAHHDDQRPGRGRLGRRRNRSRSLHARPAHLHAAAAGRRLQAATASLPEGATATDLVLTVTQMLRKKGVVGKFVEFYGDGVGALSLADRATIANMAPEYGATIGFFPIDHETLDYLRITNRPPEQIALVEAYAKEQGLFRTDARRTRCSPTRSSSISRPWCRRWPDPSARRIASICRDVKKNFLDSSRAPQDRRIKINGSARPIQDGSVVIAAITSCTNTSNPSVLMWPPACWRRKPWSAASRPSRG